MSRKTKPGDFRAPLCFVLLFAARPCSSSCYQWISAAIIGFSGLDRMRLGYHLDNLTPLRGGSSLVIASPSSSPISLHRGWNRALTISLRRGWNRALMISLRRGWNRALSISLRRGWNRALMISPRLGLLARGAASWPWRAAARWFGLHVRWRGFLVLARGGFVHQRLRFSRGRRAFLFY